MHGVATLASTLQASGSTGCEAEIHLRWAQPLGLPLELFCFFATFTHEPLLQYIFASHIFYVFDSKSYGTK